ncbi:MAG: transglutaminase family protein [Sediminicola sp.]|tara:strand:- start:143107 stop:143958 length:852 start_codon:yes stop_codon:yes gene_type:complete
MSLEYSITYSAENQYENWVDEAFLQFLIIPEDNSDQELLGITFTNTLRLPHEFSLNGLGFRTIKVHPKTRFKDIGFKAVFKVRKHSMNPFENSSMELGQKDHDLVASLAFKVDHEPYLKITPFTQLPVDKQDLYLFNKDLPLFQNLQDLNSWVFEHLVFKTNVTAVDTPLEEVVRLRQGVCQDFTHLFCALSRRNHIPTRYVSGYLHQGNGYFGDSQMHAWTECFVPGMGWIGFDPTNNLLASENHIKVAHGKDYTDCPPLKGVVYSIGKNKTSHTVEVSSQQ